jgi:uncharacterized protein YecE (DUF72 family)
MEFGKIPSDELEQIDFNLPQEPAINQFILHKEGHQQKQIHVGCAKWGRKDWIGKFYPQGTKEKDFLSYYARLFDCIELNATFYKTPSLEQIKRWKGEVAGGFKFCPKFPQLITHMKRLRNCEREVDRFFKAIFEFDDNLGCIFLMPHPQMGPKQLEIIHAFVESLPKDIDLYLELRHPDWYIEGLNKEIFEVAKNNKVGLIISDAAGRRDCVHMHLSKAETFIRFVGNSLHKTDYTRIDDWVERIKYWLDNGLNTLYYFMHQHEEVHSPELSKYLIEQMNAKCGLNIPVPTLLN